MQANRSAYSPNPAVPESEELREHVIKQRRPMLSGQFYAVPVELRRFARRLSLDAMDLAIVIAIDDRPSGWDWTYDGIATEALCSPSTAKRHLGKLVRIALVGRKEVRFGGHRSGFRYDLTPLWEELGRLLSEAQNEPQGDGPTGQIDPKPTAQIEPTPVEGLPSEV